MDQEMNIPPRPWSVAPLVGKYYGTKILDADGDVIIEIWLNSSSPKYSDAASEMSPREEYTEEEIKDGWADWTHSEKVLDYETASAIVDAVNAL